jgi:hypothetical protein
VPTEYNHEVNAQLIYELGTALMREGLGTAEIWRQCRGNSLAFAQQAINSGLGQERLDLIQRNVEYHLEVSDVVDSDGLEQKLGDGRLSVAIECTNCGYVKIGPAIEALEREAEGLGAAFYWILTYTLYRVMRLYNHDDALMYEERLRESAEEEDPQNRDQYEFPEVEKALPESIRKTRKHDFDGWQLRNRRLLARFKDGRHGSWIGRLRRIQRLARLALKHSRADLEAGSYDSPPLPAMLVAFQERDAITACFDEESQYMLEGSSEPAEYVTFSPRDPVEVRMAMRVVGRFVELNYELFQLVEEIQEWEKRHADRRLDRGEPSLRVA